VAAHGGVFVENKSGRGLIKAKQFIDATGDGDLCARLGLETYYNGRFQPATTCAILEGWPQEGFDFQAIVREHREAFNLPQGFQWGAHIPDTKAFMLAGSRVHHADCSQAEQFTAAEIEGRRQVRAMLDLIRQHAPQYPLKLIGLPARIGIRESRHVRAHYQLTGDDVLHGRRFPDAIANGSYRVDIHHQDKPGLTFRYLDGRESYISPGEKTIEGRWRPVTAENPTFYQIPYRAMVPKSPYPNLLMAGRMIDADEAAHGAIRVMVNMNQTGEAAGVAATLALDSHTPVADLDTTLLGKKLAEGGSIII
jgi:hypothetical protein